MKEILNCLKLDKSNLASTEEKGWLLNSYHNYCTLIFGATYDLLTLVEGKKGNYFKARFLFDSFKLISSRELKSLKRFH